MEAAVTMLVVAMTCWRYVMAVFMPPQKKLAEIFLSANLY